MARPKRPKHTNGVQRGFVSIRPAGNVTASLQRSAEALSSHAQATLPLAALSPIPGTQQQRSLGFFPYAASSDSNHSTGYVAVSGATSVASGTTNRLGVDRRLSPITGTPSSSSVSTEGIRSGKRPSNAHANDGPYQTQFIAEMQDVLAGIDNPQGTSSQLEAMQNVRFISSHSPGHEPTANRPRAGKSPWTPLRFNRGGRTGSLTKEQADEAKHMRSHGSCMKCHISRDKCDTGNPCAKCRAKARRPWRLRCLRGRLKDRLEFLVPSILNTIMAWENVYKFIQTTTESWRGLPFLLPVTQYIGDPFHIQVREAELLTHELSKTYDFQPSDTIEEGTEHVALTSPPLLPFFPESAKMNEWCFQITDKVLEWLRAFARTRPSEWPSVCFDSEHQAWEREMMTLVCNYHDPNMSEHSQLEVALELIFLNYIMIHPFVLPKDEVEQVFKRLHHPAFKDKVPDGEVMPRGVDIYIKMLLHPILSSTALQVLRNLDDILIETKNLTAIDRELAFCQVFICLAVIGKFQFTVLQYTQVEPTENEEPISKEEAMKQVGDMEDELASTLIELYVRRLRPSLKADGNRNFFNRLRQATEDSVPGEKFEGDTLLRYCELQEFLDTNVGRLLRRFYKAVIDVLAEQPGDSEP